MKWATAIASVCTAIALPPLVPQALALIHTAKLSDARRVQLEVTNAELAVLTERLTEVDQLKTQLFANVSHELRTPLALILGPLEKLRGAGGLTQDQRHDVEVVERNARMVLRHVNDLLDVSKLEAGRMELGCTDVDLARVVRLSAAHFETLAQERQIAFAVETTPSVPAHVDPEKLQRVFLNLLSNAFKFTPDGGQVRCVLDAVGEHIAVAIQDSGPGALREAIFDRFHQGDGGTTRRVGGTGLGLAIAKEFVELHGGTITVEDAPGGGALFSVVLPLVAPMGPGVSQAEEEHSQPQHRRTPPGAGRRGEHARPGGDVLVRTAAGEPGVAYSASCASPDV